MSKNIVETNIELTINSKGISNGYADFFTGEESKEIKVHADIVDAVVIDENNRFTKLAIFGAITEFLDKDATIGMIDSADDLYKLNVSFDDEKIYGTFKFHIYGMTFKGNIDLPLNDLRQNMDKDLFIIDKLGKNYKFTEIKDWGKSKLNISVFGGVDVSIDAENMNSAIMAKVTQLMNGFACPEKIREKALEIKEVVISL